MNITLESGQFGWDYLIVADDGRDILVQSDWDYPGVARTFGWSWEGDDADYSGEIAAAAEYLDDNIGATAEDPGYFGED